MKSVMVYFVCFILFTIIMVDSSKAKDKIQNYDYKDFSGVSVGWGMQLNITQSNEYSIEVKANEKDFTYLKVEKKGDKLRIYIDKRNFHKTDDIYVNISMPELTDLTLSGGSHGKITMDVSSENFIAGLSGGSILEGKLKCGNVEFDLSGGSRIKLSGNAGNLNADASGGSILKLKEFSVKDVDADFSGGSMLTITMDGNLDADASGGCEITYYGKAKIGHTSFSGGSSIAQGD